MKITLHLFVSLFLFSLLCAQTNEDNFDKKYLSTLLYLKTNDEIIQKINHFHGQWLKKKTIKKEKSTNFNISKFVMFLPMNNFKKDSVLNPKLYREKYFFMYEEKPLFEKILPKVDSKLLLVFSKPIENYLIAEFVLNHNDYIYDVIDNIQGPVMHLLFYFDDDNIVKNVDVSYSYVN